MSIGKEVLWKQRRQSEIQAVRADSLLEEVQGVFLLHATGLPNGKQVSPNNLSAVATGTITYLSGLHSRANRTFGKVISRFNALVGKEDKKILPLFQELAGKL